MSLPTRRLVAAGLCVAAGLAGTALLAPSAQAVPGLTGKQVVSAASAADSTPTKTVQAKCPAGKAVISGGALVDGPAQVKLTELRPVQTGNLFSATARNTWGRASWRLFAYAVCADPPAGLAYVAGDSVPNAGPQRIAVAACPAGKQVLGVGARAAVEAGRNVTLHVVFPPAQTAWASSTEAQGGEPDPWTTRAYAVCADPVGATKVEVVGPLAPGDVQSSFASCAPGKLAAIGGIMFADVAANSGQIGLAGIYPDATLTSGQVIGTEDHDGYAGSWSVSAYAICA